MDNEKSDPAGHLRTIGLTFWLSFILGVALGSSFVERLLVGAGLIVGVLLLVYSVRWLISRGRGAGPHSSAAAPVESIAGNLFGFYLFPGIPATVINLFCYFMLSREWWVSGEEPSPSMPEIMALLWALAAVSWFCVAGYLALKGDWRAVGVAAGAGLLGMTASVLNLVWLWHCLASWGPPTQIRGFD